MKGKSFFSAVLTWLGNTEMFARPSKHIPGKWQLYEYYTEPEELLLHVEADEMKQKGLYWEIEFTGEERYLHSTNLTVPLISSIENGTWSRSKNFITLIHPKDFRNNVVFQFAVEKGTLKLLKKDPLGKIEIFGFLKKPENPAAS